MATGGAVVNNGRNALWKRRSGTSVTAFTKFVIGTGTTTPATTDTAMATPILAWAGGVDDAKTLLSTDYDTTNHYVICQGYVDSTEANGNTITEAGIVNTDGTPILWCRDVFTGIVKNNQTEIILEFTDEAT